ncbi:MAG: response regulator [Chlorobiaceae bacterium]|nr:response regulator [Chlorobiaceae bacterium]
MKILLADDDPTMRVVLEGLTSKWGYQPIVAEDGRIALDLLKKDDAPNLAIVDWMMPNLTGIEVCHHMKTVSKVRPLYIVMLTASRTGTEDVVAALEAGADDFIMKPFEPTELHARIHAGERIIELQLELQKNIKMLQDTLAQVKTLSGLLPICAWCKNVRDDNGYWQVVETYIKNHTEIDFSHGICPDCKVKYFPNYSEKAD